MGEFSPEVGEVVLYHASATHTTHGTVVEVIYWDRVHLMVAGREVRDVRRVVVILDVQLDDACARVGRFERLPGAR